MDRFIHEDRILMVNLEKVIQIVYLTLIKFSAMITRIQNKNIELFQKYNVVLITHSQFLVFYLTEFNNFFKANGQVFSFG